MTRGPKSWHAQMREGEYEHFLLRRRADLAEPFAELSLTPHPWPARALERIGSKVFQTLSLFLQLRGQAGGTRLNVDSPQWADLVLTLSYPNRPNWPDLRWESGDITVEKITAISFDSHPDGDEPDDENRRILNIHLRKEQFPLEAIDFLISEMRLQIHDGQPVLAIPRPNSEVLPSDWLESMWDLRIRLTDFARRFLACFRPRSFVDPFSVFFLTPASISKFPKHIHSGQFGYEFVLDGGQVKYLQDYEMFLDPDKPLRLPFPNGVCASVFLEARASSVNDLTAVRGSYRDTEVPPHVRNFEEAILGNGLLIEIPAYAPGIGVGAADGPELIVTFRIKPPYEAAGPTDEPRDDRPAGAASDDPITAQLASKYPHILKAGEGQILTEICQRLISIYLRARPSGIGQGIVFRSPEMLGIREKYLRIAQSDFHVLIGGDSGTGKSSAAEEMVRFSRRSTKPFKRISAATISQETTMSQLFGHAKGAFNDAEEKVGLLTVLHQGTLFLDDVDALDLLSQARLLSYMDTHKFHKFGAENEAELESDVRLICATHLKKEQLLAKQGNGESKMRLDFYYRITEQYFEMPKLKNRKEDIPIFIRLFVENEHERAGRQYRPVIDPSFEEYAQSLLWEEGDLRQLRHAVLRAMNQFDTPTLTDRELRQVIGESNYGGLE